VQRPEREGLQDQHAEAPWGKIVELS